MLITCSFPVRVLYSMGSRWRCPLRSRCRPHEYLYPIDDRRLLGWLPDNQRRRSRYDVTNGMWPSVKRNIYPLTSSPSQPIVATQTDLPPSLSPIGTTFMIFSQNFGSALFVSFGATIFNARLAAALVKYVPGADVQRVLSAGALGAREAVRPDQVAGLLLAYNSAIVQVFVSDHSPARSCLFPKEGKS